MRVDEERQDSAATWWDTVQKEHEETLVVGTRVRVHLGECKYWGHTHRGEGDHGAIGVVSRYEHRGDPSHRIQVWFSPPCPLNNGHQLLAGMYAAAELIVIDTLPPDDGRETGE